MNIFFQLTTPRGFTVTIFTSNKHNYSHTLCSETLALTVTEHTHAQFVSAMCTPCRLLVYSNVCGVEAKHWHILTVLHLISGCCIQIKKQGDGLEQSSCLSVWFHPSCGLTKQCPCIISYSVYTVSICICLCGPDVPFNRYCITN